MDEVTTENQPESNPIVRYSGEITRISHKFWGDGWGFGTLRTEDGRALVRRLCEGADIVVCGRCVDSAVTLAACIHAFGWTPEDLDQLAQGSLAGHLLECGTQATGRRKNFNSR